MTVHNSVVEISGWIAKMGTPKLKVSGRRAPRMELPCHGLFHRYFSVKQKLLRPLRQCSGGRTKQRYLIIINLLKGHGAHQSAEVLGVRAWLPDLWQPRRHR
jgi:hypothetical protein